MAADYSKLKESLQKGLRYDTLLDEMKLAGLDSGERLLKILKTLEDFRYLTKYNDLYLGSNKPYTARVGMNRLTPAEIIYVFLPENKSLEAKILGAASAWLLGLSDKRINVDYRWIDYDAAIKECMGRYELRIHALQLLRNYLAAFSQFDLIGVLPEFLHLSQEDLTELEEYAENYERLYPPSERIPNPQIKFRLYQRTLEAREQSSRGTTRRGRRIANQIKRNEAAEKRILKKEAELLYESSLARLKGLADRDESSASSTD